MNKTERDICVDYLLNYNDSKLTSMIKILKNIAISADTPNGLRESIIKLELFDSKEVKSVDLLGNKSTYKAIS